MKEANQSNRWIVTGWIVLLVVMITSAVIVIPYMELLSEPETQERFKSWVISLGMGGWLIVVGMQMLQIFIAFIPGEPIEILAGVLYGGFGGLLICLIGCVAASSGIFMLSKRFGAPLVAKLFREKKMDEFAFIKDSRKLEMVVFILFLLPGTPKDMLTYIAGANPMKLSQFLIISTFARIPSVISSTFIGSSIRQGKWEIAIIIFALTAVAGILGIVYKDSIIGFCKKAGQRLRRGRDEKEKP